jgi:hypothetical protein
LRKEKAFENIWALKGSESIGFIKSQSSYEPYGESELSQDAGRLMFFASNNWIGITGLT